MKILFATAHFGFLRNFESGLRSLAGRGHRVHLLADRRDSLGGMRTVERLLEAHPDAFTFSTVPGSKSHVWRALATSLRLSLDYWRYLDPQYDHSPALRARARGQVPSFAVPLARLPLSRLRWGRRGLARIVRACERALPPSPHVGQVLDDVAPDVVIVTPLLYFGSQQVDYVRAARARGIPTLLGVGSWDHLTTKGLIHEVPDLVTVWNEAQREEAVRFHGVPPEVVEVTGSPAYDHWFQAEPSVSRANFLAAVGLPADRPLLLYLCSSPFIAPSEVGFVRRWIRAVRSSGQPMLGTAPILVRPHPQNAEQWKDVDLSEYGNVAIWPRTGANPVDQAARNDYYHSMFYSSVVVGVNTSALIESGIVGRPVCTVRDPEFAATQDGTLHFQHLKTVSGGLLSVADTLDEHCRQLAALCADPASGSARGRAFVEAFIRPRGRDQAAGPLFADAVERVGRRGRGLARQVPLRDRLVRLAFYPLAVAADRVARRPAAKREARQEGLPQRRLLFVMGSPEYLRFFDETIRQLAASGHKVRLAVNAQRDAKQVRAERLVADTDGVEFAGLVPARGDLWAPLAAAVRGTMDFVRYLDPRFSGAPVLRARIKRKCLPRALHWLDRIRSLHPGTVRALLRLLALAERGIPVSPRVQGFVRAADPDAVLVTPLVDAASDQVDTVRAAAGLGVPTAACIASWDNLTNKGLLRVQPDLVTVWNEIQVTEAVEFHGVARDRVVITGAQPFDRWFEKRPSRTREQFCAEVGLDPGRPIVLFTGSSFFISGLTTEAPFVRKWLQALRGCAHSSVSEANVLVRPHPYNADQWAEADLSDLGPAAIWPRGRHNPADERNRTDFFDSLFHCDAVVGVNTSAMIEAAILGKPVHAVLTSDFAGTQEGTLHFRYLLPEHGGFLRVSRTFTAHFDELARSLEDPATVRAEADRFVASFIRPLGRDRPCAPVLAEAVGKLAAGPRCTTGTDWAGLLVRPFMFLLALAFAAGVYFVKGGRGKLSMRKRLRSGIHHARKRTRNVVTRARKAVTRGPRALSRRWSPSKPRHGGRGDLVSVGSRAQEPRVPAAQTKESGRL
jgi:hypothetical protein